MLQYKVAKEIFKEIKEKVAKASDEELYERYEYFIFTALVYANTLTVWSQLDADERSAYQERRKEEYLEYAVELYKICLDLDIDVLDDIFDDEEEQSDFACYIQLFVSLLHRSDDSVENL